MTDFASLPDHAFLQALRTFPTDYALLVDPAGCIRYPRDLVGPLLGWEAGDLIGQPLAEFFHEADRAALQASLQQVWQEKRPLTRLYRVKTKGGQYRWLENEMMFLPDAGQAALVFRYRDVTDQVAERQQAEMLSHIASKINNGVLVVDAQGAIEWANESFNAFTGYTLAQTIGRKPGEMILDTQETGELVLTRMRENLKNGQPFSEDVVLRSKIGEKRWFTAEATPVPGPSPAALKTYIILTDITQRKRAEEQLQQQAEDLFRRNRDLQQFTYIVSHNLRAPVVNTLGLANMLRTVSREGPLFEEVIDKLQETARRLDGVIQDLNTLVGLQDKSPTAIKQPVVLSEVIQQVAASLQTALQEVNGKLELVLGPELALDSNKAYLYSIFYNLVSNAIKYRSKNRPLEIKIKSFSAPAGTLVLAISDNGTGMDLDKVGSDLFKLYKRFNTTVEGKGMGLFLVKTQVEALGGRIEVSSQAGAGTTFTLFFKII